MTSPLIFSMHEDYEIDHINESVSNDENDRDLSSSGSHAYYGNYSITTSVTIRVTPRQDYMVSWGILWGLFLVATTVAAVQCVQEQRVLAERRRSDDVEHTPGTDGEGVSTADATRGMVRISCCVYESHEGSATGCTCPSHFIVPSLSFANCYCSPCCRASLSCPFKYGVTPFPGNSLEILCQK